MRRRKKGGRVRFKVSFIIERVFLVRRICFLVKVFKSFGRSKVVNMEFVLNVVSMIVMFFFVVLSFFCV